MSGSYPKGMDVITLNSVNYGLDTDPTENSYVQIPQPQFLSEEREVFWSAWTQRDFANGERLEAILSRDDLEAGRYHDGEGVDVGMLAQEGQVKVQPALARSLAVQSATMPMAVSSDGTRLLVGLAASPWLKIWTSAGGWVNPSSGLSAAVTDLIAVGSTYYAVMNATTVTSTDGGDTWAATSPAHTNAVGLAYANGDVYILKSGSGAGRVYNHTQQEDVSAITGEFIAGYRENIYWGADSRLYLYNGRSVTLYDQMPPGFIMTGLVPYRSILLILGYYKQRSGKRGAIYYIIQGSENHLYSLGTAGDVTSDYAIRAAAGSDDEIFFASPKRGGADRYDMGFGGVASGPATGTAMYIPPKSMAICEGYLWIGRYDNAAGTDGVWQADLIAPTTYRASGWLTTPTYDFNYPLQKKLYRDIRVEHLALTTGQSIAVSYSLDNGTTWTAAVTSNTVGGTSASTTLSNIKGEHIKLKATLTSGASSTTTPTMTKLVVRAVPVTEAKWMWQLRITAYPKYGGATVIAAIKTAYAAQAQLAFVDIDRTTSYNVVISDARIIRKPSPKDNYAVILVELREV
jgi:hypothetical protein